MRHGSLFSGIGGFDLAAWWMGWKNIFNVEIDPFCRHVLKTHFPFAEQFSDIRKFKGKRYYETIDIISGGFPCQPFSIAGQRRGSKDDRYLWPDMLRIIDEIRPAWVVGENVAGILSMVQSGVQLNMAMQAGLTKENQEIITEYEFVVETICKDFERIGYSIQPFLIPACSTGAPHRRNRVWLLPAPVAQYSGRKFQLGGKITTRTGQRFQPNLQQLASVGLLPTPTARDWKGAQARSYNQDRIDNLPGLIRFRLGKTGQLSPLFVGEMMGFPDHWLTSPFLNGEKKDLNPSEMR